VAAYQKNCLAPDVWSAVQNKICDTSWKLDFGKLFEFAGGEVAKVKKAALFGSRPPQNDSVWDAARRWGFDVTTYDRNIANHEKKIDTDIVATMIEDSYEILTIGKDEITLVAGDSDYVPAIEKLKKRGIPVHVVFWKHASHELKEVANKFIPLDDYLAHLSQASEPEQALRHAHRLAQGQIEQALDGQAELDRRLAEPRTAALLAARTAVPAHGFV